MGCSVRSEVQISQTCWHHMPKDTDTKRHCDTLNLAPCHVVPLAWLEGLFKWDLKIKGKTLTKPRGQKSTNRNKNRPYQTTKILQALWMKRADPHNRYGTCNMIQKTQNICVAFYGFFALTQESWQIFLTDIDWPYVPESCLISLMIQDIANLKRCHKCRFLLKPLLHLRRPP